MQALHFGNRFIFPAPDPSYTADSYKRHLCWIPWNEVISPDRANDDTCGAGIPCLWFSAPKAATVILYFHANAEDLGMSFALLKHMRDQFKVNVLAVEYPGYGLLHGMTPSEDAVHEAALTAFRYLASEVNIRYAQIILFGRSIGSGPAVHLAAQYPVGGLILASAFSSIKAAVQSIAGRFFAWTFQERFPNCRIIANVSCSTLFIHGQNDGLIPPEHSVQLFKRCRARKLLITPQKMEHNSNLFSDANFLAVPAIHFFGFPGYSTPTPPRLPACVFENPNLRKKAGVASLFSKDDQIQTQSWLCGCLVKNDQHQLDMSFCRQERSVEDGSKLPVTPPLTERTGLVMRPPLAELPSARPENPKRSMNDEYMVEELQLPVEIETNPHDGKWRRPSENVTCGGLTTGGGDKPRGSMERLAREASGSMAPNPVNPDSAPAEMPMPVMVH